MANSIDFDEAAYEPTTVCKIIGFHFLGGRRGGGGAEDALRA